LLAASLAWLTFSGCGETHGSRNSARQTANPQDTAPQQRRPPPAPTVDEGLVQTPTDFGYNTRVVDGDIHVWHAPHCRPIPPAEFVASVILTDLDSGSHLYLNRDGSVRTSPAPDYRTDEGRERLAGVLADNTLMELILTPFECP
jgi:hypothetical protein